jgi:diacylglycerol kinase family enzyme
VSDFQRPPQSGVAARCAEAEKSCRKHLFIINPRSFRYAGGPDKIIAEIHAYFQNDAREAHHIHISRYPRDAVGVIRRFAAKLSDGAVIRVYAVGGDGILFDCLNGIVGMTNAELAVMPYGSSNDFVHSFGGENVRSFCDIAAQVSAGTVKTDILYCGSNYAMNFCAVGVESASVMYTLRLMRTFDWAVRLSRRVFVPLLFIIGGICGILNRKIREQRYSITLDGERADGSYAGINIANGPCYGGNLSAVTGALPDDGVMDTLFLNHGNALQIFKMLPDYLRGGYYKYPKFFSYRRVRRVEISSETPMVINLDGEVFFDMSLTVEVIPQAIEFVAACGSGYKRRSDARESQ